MKKNIEVLAKILAAAFLAIFLLHKMRGSPETRYGFQDRIRNAAKKALKNSPNIFASASIFFFIMTSLSFSLIGLEYPETLQIPSVTNYHGTEIIDPYQWLEDDQDPAVQIWSEEQQHLTDRFFESNPYRSGLHARIRELVMASTNVTFSAGSSKRLITLDYNVNDEQPVYYVQEDEDAPLVEILNPNEWGVGYHVDFFEPSPDGNYIAFGISSGGNESPIIYLIDLNTCEILDEPIIGWIHRNCVWHPNSKGFYYTCRPKKEDVPKGDEYFYEAVYYHQLGTSAKKDHKLLEDKKIKDWWITLNVDNKNVLIYRSRRDHKGESYYEIFAQSLKSPRGDVNQIASKTYHHHFQRKAIGKHEYLISRKKSPNGEILQIKKDKDKRIIKESDGIILDLAGIGEHLAVTYLYQAHTVIKIFTEKGKFVQEIPLPGLGVATFHGNWNQTTGYVLYSSLTHPFTSYEYDLSNNALKTEVSESDAKFDPSLYTTKEVWVSSHDGTPVSMFLAHRKHLDENKTHPTLLTGYGGFHINILPEFNKKYIPWLESGGIIAVPNLRGGGEYGVRWHQKGVREHKQNVFDDFIASAEWLIDNGYTSSDQLAIVGGSNGGLLMGAVLTQRPDLFQVVSSNVPLMDMLRFQHFKIGSLWVSEYGCADHSHQFPYLLKYSPYHNLIEGVAYPATLISTGQNDFRVDPLHARKMIARLQASTSSDAPILLNIDQNSGHHPSSLRAFCNHFATEYSFLMEQVKMPKLKTRRSRLHKQKREERILKMQKQIKQHESLQKHAEKQTQFMKLKRKHKSASASTDYLIKLCISSQSEKI